MPQTALPLSLSRLALGLTPPAFLERVVEVAWMRVQDRHPRLMSNLARLPAALIILEPTDSPHGFALRLGCSPPTLTLLAPQEKTARAADAHVKGPLEALVNMLEGRADGDTLFFSRDIQVTGDTAAIVGLRNTLDREEIDLFSEILSLFGPFAKPAGLAMGLVDRALEQVKKK